MQHTHSDRLERWLGADAVARLSLAQKDFYKPIAVHGVPGAVYAMPGGDFCGEIRAGSEMSAVDRAVDQLNRMRREQRASVSLHKIAQSQSLRGRMDRRAHAFASLSALVAAATTAGKMQNITFQKTGVAVTTIGTASSLWQSAGQPAAGAVAAAAPGGTVPTSATTGALPYWNASTANTNHFTTGYASASVINNTLLLYDRLFAVLKTASSSAAEAVTGAPSRYTNVSPSASDSASGNFCTVEAGTALGAFAHTWLSSTYTNSTGVASHAFQGCAGFTAACPIQGIDVAPVAGTAGSYWFMPLQAGDVGVQKLTNIQCSVATVTGSAVFVIGHPIAYMPCPIANMTCMVDGVNTAFNLEYIFDNACLSFLEMPKPATGATTYGGMVTYVGE